MADHAALTPEHTSSRAHDVSTTCSTSLDHHERHCIMPTQRDKKQTQRQARPPTHHTSQQASASHGQSQNGKKTSTTTTTTSTTTTASRRSQPQQQPSYPQTQLRYAQYPQTQLQSPLVASQLQYAPPVPAPQPRVDYSILRQAPPVAISTKYDALRRPPPAQQQTKVSTTTKTTGTTKKHAGHSSQAAAAQQFRYAQMQSGRPQFAHLQSGQPLLAQLQFGQPQFLQLQSGQSRVPQQNVVQQHSRKNYIGGQARQAAAKKGKARLRAFDQQVSKTLVDASGECFCGYD